MSRLTRLAVSLTGIACLVVSACSGGPNTPPTAAPSSANTPITGASPTTTPTVTPTPFATAAAPFATTPPVPTPSATASPTTTLTPQRTIIPIPTSVPTPTRTPTSPPTAATRPTATPTPQPITPDGQRPRPVPAPLGLDPFYKKYLDADGIPIVSSQKVPDAALMAAHEIVTHMLVSRPDVQGAMRARHALVAIMGQSEVTTDIPEHRDLYIAFPGTDWNTRARGLGGTVQRPATSGAEENLLCYSGDRYRGENILIHEFSHGIMGMGIAFLPEAQTFDQDLRLAYDNALSRGLWANTYAATNIEEYWAEGVQDWFDTNLEALPTNGIHNQVNTRRELQVYDPGLAALIARFFPDDTWRYRCP